MDGVAASLKLKRYLLVKKPRHIADESENRYVANHATIGKTAVNIKAIAEASAHPKYIDVVYGEYALFWSTFHPL